jgi:lysophospholipase L1-like esterase
MFSNPKFYLGCLLTALSIQMMAQEFPKNKSLKFLALGDSYTIGESVAEDQRWPRKLVEALRKKGYLVEMPHTIATTGWRTDDLMHAINKDHPSKDYDLVSLLIGVNNQYQGKSAAIYSTEFEALLDTAIEHAGNQGSMVFVLSIPDYGFTPFGKKRRSEISSGIDVFNTVNRSIAEKKGVKYIDITDISREGLRDPELVASDGLHPSAKMYGLWVDRIIQSLVKE